MSDRSLQEAMKNAARLRDELPHLIQPSNTDRDMVVLADELERLQGACLSYEKQAIRDALDLERLSRELAEAKGLLRSCPSYIYLAEPGPCESDLIKRIDAFLAATPSATP